MPCSCAFTISNPRTCSSSVLTVATTFVNKHVCLRHAITACACHLFVHLLLNGSQNWWTYLQENQPEEKHLTSLQCHLLVSAKQWAMLSLIVFHSLQNLHLPLLPACTLKIMGGLVIWTAKRVKEAQKLVHLLIIIKKSVKLARCSVTKSWVSVGRSWAMVLKLSRIPVSQTLTLTSFLMHYFENVRS